MPQNTNKIQVSAIITTFNEEVNIAEVIDSVQWADEILVVDSYSDDKTAQIAKEMGAIVLFKQYISPATQKNWAIKQAKHKWVFILDADERCTDELADEIIKTVALPAPKECYWIRRKNYFMEQHVRFSGWQGDKVVRLLQNHCRYEDKMVHEEIEVVGKVVGQLNRRIIHYTFRDYDHFLSKMQRYAAWSAEDYKTKTGKISLYHLWIKPLYRFFSHYILQFGFLDGKVGLIISKMMAWGVFMRYLKLIELRKETTPNE